MLEPMSGMRQHDERAQVEVGEDSFPSGVLHMEPYPGPNAANLSVCPVQSGLQAPSRDDAASGRQVESTRVCKAPDSDWAKCATAGPQPLVQYSQNRPLTCENLPQLMASILGAIPGRSRRRRGNIRLRNPHVLRENARSHTSR